MSESVQEKDVQQRGDEEATAKQLRRVLLKFSHDLNNLLVGINGYAKLLLEEGHVRPEGEKLIFELLSSSDRAARMSQVLQERFLSEDSLGKEDPIQASQCFSRIGEKGAVLLVDDEEVVRSVLDALLSRAGYQVLSASSGREAISLFERHMNEIRCVLLDLTMPYMSGNLVFARLKALDPEVQVILMSGYFDRHAMRPFRPGDFVKFLKKPFEPEEMLATVAQCQRRQTTVTVANVG
ncbi:MAG: response regulator [Bdellovibrionales bacterium]|nr:response regulator [Bdellovibrionales bacterium]